MKKNKTNLKFTIMVIVLIAVFCIAITPKTLQNDTFYTIKIGEYIMQNGIDMKDPFSWHEDLDYTYPHWAYDVGTFLVYKLGGMEGIYIATIILTIILGLSIYYTTSKRVNNRLIPFLLTIGTFLLLRDYIAARAQLVTFILFIFTVYFIECFLDTGKKRYALGLIVIPALIANIHLAVFPFYFILYLPYIGEYVISKLTNYNTWLYRLKIKRIKRQIQKDNNNLRLKEKLLIIEKEYINYKNVVGKKKEPYKIIINSSKYVPALIVVMIICIFTGLLTPLKLTPYTYLVKTMQGNTTHNISEHLPLTLAQHHLYMALLVVYVAILMFTDTKIKLSDLFMLGGLIFLSFITRRQMSMVMLVGVFIINRLVVSFINKYDKKGLEDAERIIIKPIGILITGALIIMSSISIYIPKIKDKFIDEKSYPVEAAIWIKENIDLKTARIYNEYNYGSYLLYQDIPVFIDSRADLYAPEFNGKKDIFMDFINISGLNLTDMQKKLDEYDFTHFIIKKDAKLEIYLKLMNDKYEKVYNDDYFTMYKKIGV